MTASQSGSSAKGDGGGGDGGMRLLLVLGLTAFGWKLMQHYEPLILKLQPYFWAAMKVLPVLGIALALPLLAALWNWVVRRVLYPRSITAKGNDTVCLGRDEKGQMVHLKQATRTVHAQVIGTTMAGKTESVVLPWAVNDVQRGASVIIIDGKGDRDLLERFYSHVVQAGREEEFRLISLGRPDIINQFLG